MLHIKRLPVIASTLLIVIVLVAGCTLSTPTQDASPPVATATSRPPNVTDDCTIRTDWPAYTVQPGDNLTRIARITESTVDELIEANCLLNPNRLTRGRCCMYLSYQKSKNS